MKYFFFNMGRRDGGTVPGAVDNLSACAIAVAMCRFLVSNPSYIPADTEVRFITFGSEEAGLRGSRCYVERHLDELKRLDARLLNIEMVAHPEVTIDTDKEAPMDAANKVLNRLLELGFLKEEDRSVLLDQEEKEIRKILRDSWFK